MSKRISAFLLENHQSFGFYQELSLDNYKTEKCSSTVKCKVFLVSVSTLFGPSQPKSDNGNSLGNTTKCFLTTRNKMNVPNIDHIGYVIW